MLPFRRFGNCMSQVLFAILVHRLERASVQFAGELAEHECQSPAYPADRLNDVEQALRCGLFELAHPGAHTS